MKFELWSSKLIFWKIKYDALSTQNTSLPIDWRKIKCLSDFKASFFNKICFSLDFKFFTEKIYRIKLDFCSSFPQKNYLLFVQIFGFYYLGYLVFVQIAKTQIVDIPSLSVRLFIHLSVTSTTPQKSCKSVKFFGYFCSLMDTETIHWLWHVVFLEFSFYEK